MARSVKQSRFRDGIISRSGYFRKGARSYATSSDRVVAPIAGRQARHDGIAMCLLRKDIVHAMPLRRMHRVARNRRLLLLLWVFAILWWLLGWLFF